MDLPVPECGADMDGVALAYPEFGFSNFCDGLGVQFSRKESEALDREHLARAARAYMGGVGRKVGALGCIVELIRVEN